MRKALRRAKRMQRSTDISLTPLIDTALTLLIIFMVATPMVQNAVRVTLPSGQAKDDQASAVQELVVQIDARGDFYFNNKKINKNDLIKELKKMVGSNKERTVYIKADQAVAYGTVLELVDEIKVLGGVKYVA